MHDEVATEDIFLRSWNIGKRVFAPVTSAGRQMVFREVLRETTLKKNAFGVWEPTSGSFIDPRALDIVITPVVAFDSLHNRIGMGGGYFDRCFSFLKHRKTWLRPKLVGVAFACQQAQEIAPNPWDIRLYRVFSE
jgi:5-formyltetrahydrofolate cyclo-ligase